MTRGYTAPRYGIYAFAQWSECIAYGSGAIFFGSSRFAKSGCRNG